ncbi:MAG: N-formylglutamate amidohydrolase [Pirellulales bacterium]
MPQYPGAESSGPSAMQPWSIERSGDGPLVATAIHQGHEVRDELRPFLALSDADRLREEDPFTGDWTAAAPTRVRVHRSRFEVDLNRPPDQCVYQRPSDAWGLEVWRRPLPAELIDRSRRLHAQFYADMRRLLDDLLSRHRRLVVFDLHSYNHRRAGPRDEPADPRQNPVVNLGTGSVDPARWGPVIQAFTAAVRAGRLDGRAIDVRHNVRFRGGYWSRWIHQTWPERVLAFAIEVKKVFMDEWSGRLDPARHRAIGGALEKAAQAGGRGDWEPGTGKAPGQPGR